MSDLDDKDPLEAKKEVNINDFTSSTAKTVSTNCSSFLKDISDDDIEQAADDVVEDNDNEIIDDNDYDDDDDEGRGPCMDFINSKVSDSTKWIIAGIIILAYSLAAFIIDFRRALPLFVIEIICILLKTFQLVTDKYVPEQKAQTQNDFIVWFDGLGKRKSTAAGLIVVMVVIIGLMTTDPENLVSLLGLFVFLFLSFITSWNPREVQWRPVMSGVFLQLLIGVLVMKVPVVSNAFQWLGVQVTITLNYTLAGSTFVYGYLADTSLYNKPFLLADGSEYYLSPPFYFSILSVVFFFSALVSLLNYIGVIGYLVKKIGVTLAVVMGTSGPETFNCVANMFLSMTEAPLLIRPLLSDCTESELHAIMTAGFASVAGAVLAAYISFGASASDLLAATIMSAPAALAISKLVFPETKKVSTRQSLFEFEMVESEDPNMIAAASNGAALAVEMVLQIGGQLIAIIALVDMLNGWLKGIGSLIDIALSLQIITSYIFFPFAWLMGVPTYDCSKVASLIGTKIIVNEFAAFQELGVMVKNDAISSKAITIATYALCGFSNISSIGVTVGVLSSLVPGKKKVIIKLVTSAMIAGNTACFMTACIAGLFYDASLDAKDSVEFVEFDGNSTDPTV